jgi:hypothetical protein
MSPIAKGDVLAASSTGPEVGKNLSKLPQVQAVSKPGGVAPASGADIQGQRRADHVEPGAEARLARVLRSSRPRRR